MTKEELAKMIDGSEYPFTLWPEHEAAKHGLVVVYGASDDLMEFEGAIRDEFDCFEGGTALVDAEGVLPPWENVQEEGEEQARDYFRRKPTCRQIEAVWGKEDYSWTYKTDIPHVTFDIMEDGEKYCRGIVFHVSDMLIATAPGEPQ